LLFLRRAEDVGLVEENEYKWSYYTIQENIDLPAHMKIVFDYLKRINSENEPFTRAMYNANFEISKLSLLQAGIELINDIYAEAEKERASGQYFQDTLGDFYELILRQTSEAGKNGQFRTPRHIIQLMCEILEPTINDTICDVTAGTSGFLVGAYQYIISHNSTEESIVDENGFERRFSGNLIQKDPKNVEKLEKNTFYGYDIDMTMIRLGMMNLLMHNIKQPNIKHLDSLSEQLDEIEKNIQYSKILANPPFTGRIDSLTTSLVLNRVYPPKYKDGKRIKQNIQSENLFLERIVQLLQPEGKAAVIIPEGVLFGGDKARKKIREIILKDCCLEAVISLPSGVFQPYTAVKTSILVFTKKKMNSENYNTKKVWFYGLNSDGYSLDDNRRKLAENPLPEVVTSYKKCSEEIVDNRKLYFYVPVEEIESNDFDLSYNRYKELEYVAQTFESPQNILNALIELEKEITKEMDDLKDLIG
jgi:type I restriction enzyme M protein